MSVHTACESVLAGLYATDSKSLGDAYNLAGAAGRNVEAGMVPAAFGPGGGGGGCVGGGTRPGPENTKEDIKLAQ